MRFMEIANPEDQLALWRLISTTYGQRLWHRPSKLQPKKHRPQLTPSRKSSSPRRPYLNHPQLKVLYPHSLERWPPAGLHHYPAHSLCSGLPIQVVLARLICMACSSRLRVQGKPIRHKNPSNGSKPWIYDEKYCVFKFHGRGDDRHSKNGSCYHDSQASKIYKRLSRRGSRFSCHSISPSTSAA